MSARGVNEGGRCTCRGCGRVFSGLELFDAHFETLTVPPWSRCVDPETITHKTGKKAGVHRYRFEKGVWRSAEKNDRWAS